MAFYHCRADGWDLDELLTSAVQMKEFCDEIFFNHNCVCTSRMPTFRSLKMLINAIRRAQSVYCSTGEDHDYVVLQLVRRFKRLRCKIAVAKDVCYFAHAGVDFFGATILTPSTILMMNE